MSEINGTLMKTALASLAVVAMTLARPAIAETVRYDGIAHPPSGSIEIMFIKGLSIQTGSKPILSILERSAWGGIRGHVLK
jgi:hypothetical protein